MESAATAATSAQARRMNPSRSKRGGPGVGTSDVDVMILESYKRKLETEPLIPANTPFFLTTNSASISDDSTSNVDVAISINIVPNDRYFDRPEVLKAFREQELIQTPEFWPISESSSVGGRFRPRGAEDEREETSDTAYEKRHKKFETFEKRQRLREKDKLKHEHYKLKERIEQLRSMDSSAFMALPFSFGVVPDEVLVNAEADAIAEAPAQVQANGTAQSTEGERRKKAMLEHAISLEKRYSYLLPPDRVRKPQEIHIDEEESENERIPQAGSSKNEGIKLRLPPRSSMSATPVSSPAATKPPKKVRGPGKQAISARPAQTSVSSSVPPMEQTPPVSSPYIDIEMRTPEPPVVSPPPPPSLTPALPVGVPEAPVAFISAPLPKPPAAVRQTNGRGRPRKDAARILQNNVEVGATILQRPEKPAKAPKKTPRMRPIQVQIADDGESEKAPSDDGHAEIPQAAEVQPNGQELQLDQQHDEALERDVDMHMLGPDEIVPEVRELKTRLEQTEVAESLTAEAQQALADQLNHERFVAEGPQPEDSISARPTKRQKKMTSKARALSTAQSHIERTPSVPPNASAYTATGRLRKKMGPRGQQSAVYISSTTGEEVRTFSFLLMAAIRTEGAKRNVEKRHNTSFGIPTPAFKETFEFEIPEWLHYPEDEEEPAIPTSDLDPPHYQDHVDNVEQEQEQPEPPHEEPEEPELPMSMERAPEEEIPISALREEVPSPRPEVTLSFNEPEPHVPEEVISAEKFPEPQEEQMEAEPEEEEEEVTQSPTEESEPGVSIRVLSQPRDSDDEQLEW